MEETLRPLSLSLIYVAAALSGQDGGDTLPLRCLQCLLNAQGVAGMAEELRFQLV